MVLKVLLIFVPICIALRWFEAPALWVFATAALAIVPLANLLARSTEKVSAFLGPTVGALLNSSLGNAPEMIIAGFALKNGLQEVVKASLTGSMLMNLLIAPGLAMVVGGWGRERQKFGREAASMSASLMMLASIGLIIPSLFHWTKPSDAEELSLEIAIILFALYALSLLFSLHTHRHLFAGEEPAHRETGSGRHGGLGKALAQMLSAALALAIVSEVLTSALDAATHALGLSDLFAGVIVVGVLGNIAELFTVVRFARANKMDLAIGVTLGAATQVALVVAPVLVFLSYGFGDPLELLFTQFEVVALALAVTVVGQLTRDGESTWMEGAMLVAVYLMFAIGFYYFPDAAPK